MKKLTVLFILLQTIHHLSAQEPANKSYIKKMFMIPMRDGVKLNTGVLIPINDSTAYPFLIQRTPYGVNFG
ncbi:MAG: hypothetical protein ABI594_21185, partial [Ginsengibacter sp.]